MATHLLVLGGGALAVPCLRWAREAGLAATLADPDPNVRGRSQAQRSHVIPSTDVEAHVALARRLARTGLVGVLATAPEHAALLPRLAEAAPGSLPPRRVLEALLPEDGRELLARRGFPVERAGGPLYDLFALFRDGAFEPGGLAARARLASGDPCSLQPSGLAPEREHAARVLVERAARAAGLERGLLQATLVADGSSWAFAALGAGYRDLLGATEVARLVWGKSPLQAWFAHLAGAGGPFDELPRQARREAGWIALVPWVSGRFAGVDGLSRVRALPGVVDIWVEEPGREIEPGDPRPLGQLWAEGADRDELATRLGAARAQLEVRVACPQRVA